MTYYPKIDKKTGRKVDQEYIDLFNPNKSKKQKRFVFDDEEDLDNYTYQYGSYNYDWDYAPAYETGKASKKNQLIDSMLKVGMGTPEELNHLKDPEQKQDTWYEAQMSLYNKTGEWRGYNYYKPPELDYRYIEQMANALSSQYKVNIEASNRWAIDLDKKLLLYNPEDLLTATKAKVLTSLLHEIGHLRHTSSPKELKGKYYSNPEFEAGCHEVVNVFEDFRIDKIMVKSYPSAEDIYKHREEDTKELARTIQAKQGERVAFLVKKFNDSASKYRSDIYNTDSISNRNDLIEKLSQLLNCSKDEIVKDNSKSESDHLIADKIEVMRKELETKLIKEDKNLFNYCAVICLNGYGYPVKPAESIREYVKKTLPAIKKCEVAKDTQALVNILESEVYPVIEELLKIPSQKEIEKLLGKKGAQQLQEEYNQEFSGQGKVNGKGADMARKWGNKSLPPSWYNGDYDSLKRSVIRPIQELIKKLNFIKSTQGAPAWHDKQRRGRLDIKRAYKYKVYGTDRIFKRKQEKLDKIRNHAFEILVDCSGSMGGERMIQAVRGLIIMAEVFDYMRVAFAVSVFNTRNHVLKKFEDVFDGQMKRIIGGAVKMTSGGTSISDSLRSSKLSKRPEKKKIRIILTDGQMDTDILSQYKRIHKDINNIGFTLIDDDYFIKACNAGKYLKRTHELPIVFEETIKNILL